MAEIGGNQPGFGVTTVTTDTTVRTVHNNRILDVTAGVSDINITLTAGTSIPNGVRVIIRRNASSTSNVVIGSPISKTLTAYVDTCEIVCDGTTWVELPRGSSSSSEPYLPGITSRHRRILCLGDSMFGGLLASDITGAVPESDALCIGFGGEYPASGAVALASDIKYRGRAGNLLSDSRITQWTKERAVVTESTFPSTGAFAYKFSGDNSYTGSSIYVDCAAPDAGITAGLTFSFLVEPSAMVGGWYGGIYKNGWTLVGYMNLLDLSQYCPFAPTRFRAYLPPNSYSSGDVLRFHFWHSDGPTGDYALYMGEAQLQLGYQALPYRETTGTADTPAAEDWHGSADAYNRKFFDLVAFCYRNPGGWRNTSAIEAAYEALADTASTVVPRVLLMEPTPLRDTGANVWLTGANDAADVPNDLFGAVKRVAAKRNVFHQSVRDDFIASGITPSTLVGDSVHPTDAGDARIAALVADTVASNDDKVPTKITGGACVRMGGIETGTWSDYAYQAANYRFDVLAQGFPLNVGGISEAVRETTDTGATVTYKISGRQISLIYLLKDPGGVVSVAVDGLPPVELSLESGTYAYMRTRPLVDDNGPITYPDGEHTVVVTRVSGTVRLFGCVGLGANLELDVDRASRVSGATTGNFASLTADGDLADSGKNASSSFTPSAHVSTHADGGSDEVTPLAIGAPSLHGFVDRSATLAFNDATLKLTITPSTSFSFWVNGNKFVKNSAQEVTIANTAGLHFCSESDAGALQKSMDAWDIAGLTAIPAVIIWWNSVTGRVWEERHGYRRDPGWHKTQHLTEGAKYYSGLGLTLPTTGTPGDFQLESGYIFDEDLQLTIGQQTTCIRCYRTNAGAAMTFDSTPSEVPYRMNGSNLEYDAGASGVVNASSNNYVNYWLYVTNDIAVAAYSVLGQAAHTTLAAARAEGRPTIPMSTAEWVLCYRLTYRNTGATPTLSEITDYRSVQSGPPVNYTAPATVAASNVLVDSTDFTRLLSGKTTAQSALAAVDSYPAPSAPSAGLLSVVGIANGESVYANKALFDTTAPEALGTAAAGTQLVAARRDHVHAAPRLPTIQKFTSGSGTYTTPTGVRYLKIKMVGGGGGGGSSGNPGATGSDGGATTFGSSLLTANGGSGGPYNATGGAGGTASIGAGASGAAFTGATGEQGKSSSPNYENWCGGQGAFSPFGGAGHGGKESGGGSATANTGSGGGGAGDDGWYPGSGGGAGGYLEAIITSPSATYSYAVGSGGAGGTGGGTTIDGGAGAAGIIIVEEY